MPKALRERKARETDRHNTLGRKEFSDGRDDHWPIFSYSQAFWDMDKNISSENNPQSRSVSDQKKR